MNSNNKDEKFKAASEELTALSKKVVSLRKLAKAAKAQAVRKMLIQIGKLSRSKVYKEKRQRKAARLNEEMLLVKSISPDDATKFAFGNTMTVSEAAKTGCLLTKALVRIAVQKLMRKYMETFRKEHSDWQELALHLKEKGKGRHYKPKKKEKVRPIAKQIEMKEIMKKKKNMGKVELLGLKSSTEENLFPYMCGDERMADDNAKSKDGRDISKDDKAIRNDSVELLKVQKSVKDMLCEIGQNFGTFEGEESSSEAESEDFFSGMFGKPVKTSSKSKKSYGEGEIQRQATETALSRKMNNSQTLNENQKCQTEHGKSNSVEGSMEKLRKSFLLMSNTIPKEEPLPQKETCRTSSKKPEAVIQTFNMNDLGSSGATLLFNVPSQRLNDLTVLSESSTPQTRNSDRKLVKTINNQTGNAPKKDLFFCTESDLEEGSESDGSTNGSLPEAGNASHSGSQRHNKDKSTKLSRYSRDCGERTKGQRKDFSREKYSDKDYLDGNKDIGGNRQDRTPLPYKPSAKGRGGKNFQHRKEHSRKGYANMNGSECDGKQNSQGQLRSSINEGLHPSWEASRKRKEQQASIQIFTGKHIVFDE